MSCRFMLALVAVLGSSAVHAMPGMVCPDISPTSPKMDNPVDPRSEATSRPETAALRIPTLRRDVCEF